MGDRYRIAWAVVLKYVTYCIQNTSGYVSRDDVIDLIPLSNGLAKRDVTKRDVTANKKIVDVTSKSGTNVEEMQSHNEKVSVSCALRPYVSGIPP